MTATRICAVVVTFNPDTQRLLACLRVLGGTVDGVVIVDNGSTALEEHLFHPAHPSLVMKRLGRNEGIGAAQNVGTAVSRQLGYSHVLMLDQDSVPEASMVPRLWECLQRLQAQGNKVACIGPRLRLFPTKQVSTFITFGWLGAKRALCNDEESAVECDVLLSSGCLIPLEVLEKVGGMDETFFIDQVDSDWCLRAQSMGYRIYGACGAVLEHRLGERAVRMWLGRWRRVPRHMPLRYYYIFRNTIILSRRPYTPVKWVLYNLRWLAALLVFCGLPNPGRGGELRMMWKGVVDGLRGTTGKADHP